MAPGSRIVPSCHPGWGAVSDLGGSFAERGKDLEEGALHLLMHPTDSRVHTYKVTRAFLEVKYLKEVAATSKGESSDIVFIMTELET